MNALTHYQKLTLAICLSSVVTFSNIYWLQPLIPALQDSFGLGSMAANFSMSAPLLGMGLGLLILASWSDAIGRCRILIWGVAAGLAVSLILPWVQSYSLFLVLRFLQGALLSACPAVAVPLMGDEMRKSWLPAAVGFYIASNTLGGISSRLAGGILTDLFSSWQQAGTVIAVVTAVLYGSVFLLLPRQRHFRVSEFHFIPDYRGYATHLKNPKLLAIYLLIGLAFGCFVNLTNYLMLVLGSEPFNLPGSLRSILFLTLLGGTTSSSLAGRFSRKHTLISGITTGIVIMLVANILMVSQNLLLIIAAMVLMSVGFFFCHAQASTLVGRSVRKAKGCAQALYSLFYYSGASLGVFFLEPFFQHWGWHGVLAATSLMLGLCLLMVAAYQGLSLRQGKAMA